MAGGIYCLNAFDTDVREMPLVQNNSFPESVGLCTYVNFSWQYCENMVTMVLRTMLALVRSVAVTSINTFFVSNRIFECSPFMMGGKDNTMPLES